MGNNRYNTPPKVIDYTPRKKKEEVDPLTFNPCIVCGKTITDGYWGSWGEHGGVCSKTCNNVMEARPKYPDHPLKGDTS